MSSFGFGIVRVTVVVIEIFLYSKSMFLQKDRQTGSLFIVIPLAVTILIVLIAIVFRNSNSSQKSNMELVEPPTSVPQETLSPTVTPSPCKGKLVLVLMTIYDERISFCSPITDNVDQQEDYQSSVAQISQGYLIGDSAIVNIRSISPGERGYATPIYTPGHIEDFRRETTDSYIKNSQSIVKKGPTGKFWGESIEGTTYYSKVESSGTLYPETSVEWIVEHKGKLWVIIVRWSNGLKNEDEWINLSKNFEIF